MSVPPPRPGAGPPPYDQPPEASVTAPRHLPRTLSETRRRLLAANGAAFLLTASLSGTAGGLFATRLPGGMPLGILFGVLQLTVLLLSSWWYDRTLSRHADPLVDLMRRRAELAPPSPPPQGPAGFMSRGPHSSQGRRR
ncbi:hypothetical protein [Streptomyces sp. NPDC057695]|uniref:hypothetical protein n=1 Tax=unclassified Streptomyces TaxID=2593676 RepID=UPI00362C6B44